MRDTKEVHGRLEAERSRLRRLLGWADSALKTHERQSVMENAANSGDDEFADNATETFSQEFDATMRQRFTEDLEGVEAALQRLEVGAYGRCVRCQQAIAPERLQAIPETPFCVACGREQIAEG